MCLVRIRPEFRLFEIWVGYEKGHKIKVDKETSSVNTRYANSNELAHQSFLTVY